MHSELLRAWLRQCDEFHDCNDDNVGPNTKLPTRVIYIGGPDPAHLVLRLSTQVQEARYVALSHCWGKITDEDKQRICTNNKNINDRLEGFDLAVLPPTFVDAVIVTRELGVEYLWIDSLCIIQDNHEDWKHEAALMEDVFASAYCTIAATSAQHSGQSFLKRDSASRYVQIQDSSGNKFHVCERLDNFTKDVDGARLNTRGWVLQERALARRTIHFSANQTYWECGQGVHCEDLIRLERLDLTPKYLQSNFNM